MPEVDPEDDTLTRFVIWHFRYDPDRHERRNVLVTAYDEEAEFRQAIELLTRDLKLRKARGDAEECEHLAGVVYEPGDRDRARRKRRRDRIPFTPVAPPGDTESRTNVQFVVTEDDPSD
jgi:hypothetical protein